MIPASFSNFLVASTQASAALIGLLFVAVSIAPERVFGQRSEAGRQALALSAFTALANVFFASFSSLIPNIAFGVVAVVVGGIAASQSLALLLLVPNWHRERTLVPSLLRFAVSLGVYVFEISIGVRLLDSPADVGLLTTYCIVILGVFSIGLARSWELLGAPHSRGAVSAITDWILKREAEREEKKPKS